MTLAFCIFAAATLLGSMVKPIKLDIDGEPVLICCAGCEDALRENPDKNLVNLKAE